MLIKISKDVIIQTECIEGAVLYESESRLEIYPKNRPTEEDCYKIHGESAMRAWNIFSSIVDYDYTEEK